MKLHSDIGEEVLVHIHRYNWKQEEKKKKQKAQQIIICQSGRHKVHFRSARK